MRQLLFPGDAGREDNVRLRFKGWSIGQFPDETDRWLRYHLRHQTGGWTSFRVFRLEDGDDYGSGRIKGMSLWYPRAISGPPDWKFYEMGARFEHRLVWTLRLRHFFKEQGPSPTVMFQGLATTLLTDIFGQMNGRWTLRVESPSNLDWRMAFTFEEPRDAVLLKMVADWS